APVPRPARAVTAPAVPIPASTEIEAAGDLLVLRDVSRAFGGLRAVDEVDLIVRDRSLHGIIGPNGAGKTTLFNIINGFLRPDRGTISFDGHRIDGLRPSAVCRRGIGRTFQVVRAFPRMSVLD